VRFRSCLAIAAALGGLLAGCAQSSGSLGAAPGATPEPTALSLSPSATVAPTTDPPNTPAPPGAGSGKLALAKLSVTRTGGMAGVQQTVQISPDGSWVYTNKRSNGLDRGQLSTSQQQQLARLISDPGLMREARMSPAPGDCADAYHDLLTVGEATIQYDQCSASGSRPVTEQLLNFVVDVTPL
jgi:hypothetical protein